MFPVECFAPATLLAPVKGRPCATPGFAALCAAGAAPLTAAARGGGPGFVGTQGVPLLFDHGAAGSNSGLAWVGISDAMGQQGTIRVLAAIEKADAIDHQVATGFALRATLQTDGLPHLTSP